MVKISDAADHQPSITSATVFSVFKPQLLIAYPNGNEIFGNGDETEIRWQTTGEIDSVSLYYSLNNGFSWMSIVDSIENQEAYSWQIPDVSSDSCLIRISSTESGGPEDTSDSLFVISKPSLTILAPNGGEAWESNSGHEIQWQSAGLIDSVDLHYSTDNGRTWREIVANIENSSQYLWQIPELVSDSCLVRILDSSNEHLVDVSDSVFDLATLTSVNNGDKLPMAFKLYPAFPNLFNPETKIQYDLPNSSDVS